MGGFRLFKISIWEKLYYNKIMLPSDEYTEFESRQYVNPQTVVDESNTFIDQLRATQGQQNQEITQQTQRLGTDVPTNLGGLTGGESYFSSRYQTPQTASVIADLRTTAQAAALNEALANEEAKWKKRYNDAYRKYQKSAYDKANTPAPTNPDTTNPSSLGVDVNLGDNASGDTNENTNTGPGYINSVQGGLNIYMDQNGGRWTLRNLQGGDEVLLGGLTSPGGNLLRTFPDGTPLTNGAVYNAGGGRVFMYIQNSQYPDGTFFRVGDSPTMSYK